MADPWAIRHALAILVLAVQTSVTVDAELRGTVSAVDAPQSTATVQIAGAQLPAVGDPVSITWTVGGEEIRVAEGSVVSVEGGRVQVGFRSSGSQVSPGMDVLIVSAGGARAGDRPPGAKTAPGGTDAGVPLLPGPIDVTARGAPVGPSPGGRASIEGSRLQIATEPEGWHARFLSITRLGSDFDASGSLSLVESFDESAVAGLLFDSSSPSEKDVAEGAVFFGKNDGRIIASRKTAGAWVDVLGSHPASSGPTSDDFMLRRRGRQFTFWINGRRVGAWDAPDVATGMPKFYVIRGRAEIVNWQVLAYETSAPAKIPPGR